jgi:hypothetical protein
MPANRWRDQNRVHSDWNAPARVESQQDDDSWKLVVFARPLPKLTPKKQRTSGDSSQTVMERDKGSETNSTAAEKTRNDGRVSVLVSCIWILVAIAVKATTDGPPR